MKIDNLENINESIHQKKKEKLTKAEPLFPFFSLFKRKKEATGVDISFH